MFANMNSLWLAWKLDPNSSKLNTPLIFELKGLLNRNALVKAASSYIHEFHQSARCYFYEEHNTVEQRFLDKVPVEIEYINIENASVDLAIQDFCKKPFDLSRSPLFTFGLLILAEQHYIFIMNFHHAISDAFTGDYLVDKLGKLYNHFACNLPYPKTVAASYEDCLQWKKENYTLQQQNSDLDFWEKKLCNVSTAVDFPFKKQQVTANSDSANSLYFSVDEKTTLALKQLARKLKTTPFIMLSAVYAMTLYRYTNQKNIVLAYSVNTRPLGYHDLPGYFVNELPFIFDFTSPQTFEQLFNASTAERKSSKPHQRCLLQNVLERLKKTYFNVSIHEAFLNPHPLDLAGISVSCRKPVTYALRNDLSFFYQIGTRLECRLDYLTECFDFHLIDRFAVHFTDIIQRSLNNIDIGIDINGFSLLRTAELVLHQNWNNTSSKFPEEKTLHQLFEEQMAKASNALAVSYKKQHLNYCELNLKANQLAEMICNAMKSDAVFTKKTDVIVALCLDRGLEWPVGILGTLKAGCAYLPIDIHDAENRIQRVLDDANVKIIVSQKEIIKKLPFLENNLNKNRKIIEIDSEVCLSTASLATEKRKSCFVHAPKRMLASDLAYVIYTSGTTGQPKGVMIEHRSMVNHVWDIKNKLNFDETDRVLSVTSITFDIYGLDLFLALSSGARHIICPKDSMRDPVKLAEIIQREKPTFIEATPSLLSMVLPYLKRQEQLTIFCGGEVLTESLAKSLLNIAKEVWNVYGPTETTVWSSFFKCTKNSVPYIGRAFSNIKLHVLDEALNQVPIGVIGEIYISGAGLGRGYLNDTALTRLKFIPDSNRGTLYKTNDLARWTISGYLEFIGRKDTQVKIRGHRIELSEIESAMLSHPAMVSAVVVCRKSCQKEAGLGLENNQSGNIIVYYTLKKPGFLLKYFSVLQRCLFRNSRICTEPKEALETFLKKILPSYMLPSAYVALDALPLTINGKIDKALLPAPSTQDYLTNNDSSTTFDILEVHLEQLWRTVLDIPYVGINDDFFAVGGNSLLAVQLISKINQAFKTRLTVSWILENKTIKLQALQLRQNETIMPPYNPVISFNTAGSKTPVFLVHPGLAGAEAYRELAKYLDKDIPLYALDSYNLNGGNAFLKTIEMIASQYCECIQNTKIKGPYVLGGWSLGGVIAYEMAQQLTRRQESVQMVYLLDSQLYSTQYLDLILKGISVKSLIKMLPSDRGAYIASLPHPYVDRVVASLKNDVQLLKNYVIKPYAGNVMLIETKQKTVLNRGLIENTYKGWKKNIKNLSVFQIQANHFNLMQGAQAKKVAELLRGI
jgi:amino acid adenylation domain-containing protein